MNATYKNITLAKNSHAFVLYELSKKDPAYTKILDMHLKTLAANEKALLERYK